MFAPAPRQLLYLSYKLEVNFADPQGTVAKSSHGTAFVLLAGEAPVLVTNRHVVDLDYNAPDLRYKDCRVTRLVLHGRGADDKRYALEIDGSQPFIFPQQRENDVACLISFRAANVPEGFQLYHHALARDLATAQEFEQLIWPGDQVYFAGYPAVHDKLDQRPVLRAGVIASDPRFNYSTSSVYQGDRVAYEAMSTPGASGSPVYAPARGIVGIHSYCRRDLIVGINAGHIAAEFGAHSGMSYFIKATVIRSLIEGAGIKIN